MVQLEILDERPSRDFEFEDEESQSNYRNRALERSKLKDEYHLKIENEYQQMKKQTIEESRYMGGDLEHTHLVKGLDYVLLRKIKQDMARTSLDLVDASQDETEREGIGHTEIGFYLYKNYLYHTHPRHRDFKEKFYNTFRLIQKGHKLHRDVSRAESFYKFQLQMDPDENDIPSTTVYNSQTAKDSGRTLTTFIDPSLKAELSDAFEWHHENKMRKRKDRCKLLWSWIFSVPFRPGAMDLEKDEIATDEDEDIFQNAGEYKSDEYNIEYLSMHEGDRGYFSQSGMCCSNPVTSPDNEEDVYKLPKIIRKHRNKEIVTDAYDECYPDVVAQIDSDTETAGNKKQNRAQGRKIAKTAKGNTAQTQSSD
ncbi:bifunctional Protein Red-like/RED-like [Babesia duncani]|uniref:Bifunctional Protein Red-like/RED-like n=1 Tax=Babesia duncani TaxID=323732 RepID=A0AAD9UQK2_9APIC|nr:bifunctional Protein Red-like/RED-like [Babesia duncani]